MAIDRKRPVILVIDDVEETRLGTARLLTTDGYTVITAADEPEAILKICLQPPNLILLSLGLDVIRLRALAKRLRDRSGVREEIPVVIFGAATLDEGAEVDAGSNIYLIQPDNFDQLRAFLIRLLRRLSPG